MTASVVSISAVSFSARNQVDVGGQRSILSVWFHVYRRGFAHVAGIVVTTDGWVTRREVPAQFDHFENGDTTEVWRVSHTVPGINQQFAFVCWCEDYADVDNVRKIWNTNGGNQFWVASHS